MSDVFSYTELKYFTSRNGKKSLEDSVFPRERLEERRLATRPSYPADKLTFSQPDIGQAASVRYLNMYFNLNDQFDVNVMLEDSKRNFLN